MKLNPKDRRQLYLSGSLALSLAILGAALVWWAQNETRQATQTRQEAERRAADIRQRLRQVKTEEQEIRAKSAFYRELEARRIIGPERRLDWIELIAEIREQGQLFDINYEISQQKEDGPPLGDFRVGASEMSFHLPLLHEGDLLGFLDQLQRRAPALVQVRQCDLVRLPGRADRQAGDPNLEAHCRLQWTTVGRLTTTGARP